MTTPLDMPVHLQARELLPIEDGAGLEVKCLRGNLWITRRETPRTRSCAAGNRSCSTAPA